MGEPTVAELVAAAMREATSEHVDDDAYWARVSAVQNADVDSVWPLVEALANEDDPRLRALAPDLLRFLRGASRPRKLPFVSHADARVRSAVVAAFLARAEPEGIDALIALSSDPDADVRDWATFGLGTQLGPIDFGCAPVVDTPALRDALAARLADAHADTRSEAIVAARWMAAPELCEGLRKLASSSDGEALSVWRARGLDEAIVACCHEGT